MSKRVLVTYASRAGATAGVAAAIGRTLIENGVQADVRPMQEVKDLIPYDAVVAGSAIQRGQWLPEALQFVRANQAALTQKPFAAFLVCMTLAMPQADSRYRVQVAQWLAPVRALVLPVSEGLFAGVLDIGKVPSWADRLKFRVSVALGAWAEGDHRDWSAIRAWAADLKPLLAI
jgi:menaquinone-dependent protoporphyrinogen oxidase